MHHFTASDIKSDVIGLAVMVVIEIDDVPNLHAVKAYLLTMFSLHIGTVRKLDIIVIFVAVHRKTGAVETGRRSSSGNISAAYKASDVLRKTAGLVSPLNR